jgi:phosphopantetheine adenylyltransferase
MTSEQQYWSLNGSFEALHRIHKELLSGKITSLNELKLLLISDMQLVNKQMTEYENKSNIEKLRKI